MLTLHWHLKICLEELNVSFLNSNNNVVCLENRKRSILLDYPRLISGDSLDILQEGLNYFKTKEY